MDKPDELVGILAKLGVEIDMQFASRLLSLNVEELIGFLESTGLPIPDRLQSAAPTALPSAILTVADIEQIVSALPSRGDYRRPSATATDAGYVDGADTTRILVDEVSGEEIVISGEGDCRTLSVVVRGAGGAGHTQFAYDHSIMYSVDNDCRVTLLDGSRTPVPGSAATRDEGRVEGAEINVIRGNVIHSSQTMQDVFNVDIAKLKYSHDRVWDEIGYSYYKEWDNNAWLVGVTGVPWNHAVGWKNDGYDGDWTFDTAWGYVHGDFHSDFLWCNLEPGQNFRMITDLESRWNGTFDAHFGQSEACGGTHMATHKWANTVRGFDD